MHHSFDYAQQIHFPFNAQQPGPIFFKTPRKRSIFGVSREPMSTQVNYLIDEADDVGKGANATISLLHHSFNGLKEKHLHLHADNCVGQNKNNMVIQYLVWRVIAGLSESAELSFMLVRHTKFAPDRFFGLFKRLYQGSVVDTMTDVVRVVEESSICGKNKAQLTVSASGARHVHCTEWSLLFSEFFRTISGITSYHHFKVSKEKPVTGREYANSPEEINIFKKGINASYLKGHKRGSKVVSMCMHRLFVRP